MQDTKITIRFENKLSDHIHAIRLYESRQAVAKINKIVAVLLAGFGIWAVWAAGARWWTVIWFVVAPVEWFDLLSIRPLQILVMFRANPKYREEYCLEFDDSGIHFTTPTIDSHIEWSHYNRVVESDRVFILIYGKPMYTTIPKSAFANADEIGEFRELLQRQGIQMA